MRELRDADATRNAGKEQAAVLQALEVSEATYQRWRNQYGGMTAEEAKRLKEFDDENKRLKEIVADLTLDNRMPRPATTPNPRKTHEHARQQRRANHTSQPGMSHPAPRQTRILQRDQRLIAD